jgi:hypothetical protein
MMRMLRFTLMLASLALLYPAYTLGASLDAGIIAGDPTGLSVKGWLNDTQAIDFAASWSNDGRDKRYFHADYLRHDFTLIHAANGEMPVYYGIGARVLDREDRKTRAGIRIPVGLDYRMDKLPLSLFAEVVPRLDLTPDTDFELDGAIGIRYRFMGGTQGQKDR